MAAEFCIWLLTSSVPEDFTALGRLPLDNERGVRFLGLEELYARYGADVKGGVARFNSKWDMWRWSVFRECLRRAQDADELPDIIEHGSTWTIALSSLLYDITDVIEDDEVDAASVFLSRSLRTCRPEDGQPYTRRYFAMPFTVDCRLLFYRHPFDEAYLHSWYALERKLNQLKWAEARYAVQMRDDALHDALSHIWACGGDIVRASDLRVMVNAPETIEAVMRLARLVHLGIAPGLKEAPPSLHDARLAMAMKKTEPKHIDAGMSNNWVRTFPASPNFKLADFNVTFPPRDQERIVFVGGTNLGIVKKYRSDRKGEYSDAIAVLKYLCLDTYLTRKEQFWELCETLENTPAWKYNYQIGKLPPQIRILQAWQHKYQKSRFDMFMQALWGPDHLRLPSIAQMAWIEEFMKDRFCKLWEDLDSVIRDGDWEPQCRRKIHAHFRQAAEMVKENLDGIVRVRTREKQARYFAERGLWGQLEATQQFRDGGYDLLVDEARQRCVAHGSETKFADMGGEAVTEFLLTLVRSQQGGITHLYLAREYLENLDNLVRTWHRLRLFVPPGGITPAQKTFLQALAETLSPGAALTRLEEWFGDAEGLNRLTAREAAQHIALHCPEAILSLAASQHNTEKHKLSRHNVHELTAQLRKRLGLKCVPHQKQGGVFLASTISICHILPV